MKGLNWNEIINEALLCIIRNRISKRMIVIRTGYKPWLDDEYLAHRAK